MKKIIHLFFVLVLIFVSACQHIRPKMTLATDPKAIIIDSDMNLDDCIALLYLLQKYPDDVKAITIAGTGVTFPGVGARNALGLIALGQPRNIPVASGQTSTISGSYNNPIPYSFRKLYANLIGLKLPYNPQAPTGLRAENLIIHTIRSTNNPVDVLSIGGLTNLALAIRKDPDIKKGIRAIYIMGGALKVSGNLMFLNEKLNNRMSELNIYVDPEAANEVIKSGIPIFLIPLDICDKFPVDTKFYNFFKNNIKTPQTEFVFKILKRSFKMGQKGKFFLWDPLAAVALSNKNWGKYENCKIRVITVPGKNYGRTIIDKKRGTEVKVLVSIDHDKVEKELLDVLNR